MRNVGDAPELGKPDLLWFNVEEPLTLEALRGRLVILDFWTFCCINCIHIIPALRAAEERYPDDLAVIGVHSPKFDAEKDPENVAQAIARYEIVHPVVHDPEFTIWKSYGVRAWPTLVFISPDGQIIGHHSGEVTAETLIDAVPRLLDETRSDTTPEPRPLNLSTTPTPERRLTFPGKMKALAEPIGSAVYALTDSGGHQIVLLDRDGAETRRYGSGEPGFDDGPAETATFRYPQGLTCSDDAIYVADTNNHAIRRIDIRSGNVTTLAGNGTRGPILGERDIDAWKAVLASVWDLEVDGDRLYFANAGTHQLGELDLAKNDVRLLAGSGAEGLKDGAAFGAALAQPSGLALSANRKLLYFADSETSSIRQVSLGRKPEVTTLIGTGLFDFGHVNGSWDQAQLQHPLGVSLSNGTLYVADSYNAALRVIDLDNKVISDLDDGSFICLDPICYLSAEPAGVLAHQDRLFLVDTNNHRVVEYRPQEQVYETWAQ
ncbi:redoxin domain-containing protein [Candidatus Poribacteria bacterium]|nr:redoxin domain-containing protein [Candidatus Poribacteria bacterium]MBT5536645.1 redoxin domain-containing protein [Candidatus Poribacteria bacterium]MBT5712617.1 redoxin domain-containing protein [Candidatus Poribacteria bacterium]MBT7096827.1 redoxin domain-containing protein [Candidatus Poribacteria bacterium]MBT7804426.1 redoxin domain-containing protein [Candidatus Poribacteria bacterium]